MRQKQYETWRNDGTPTKRLCACREVGVTRGVVTPYCPTVKSIRFSTAPAASLTSTCQAPVKSAGTVLRLHVRHGEPPTCSSTSPTWVSPWNHTWWSAVPAAPRSEERRVGKEC